MRLLYLTDRLSVRGGADLHFRQVINWAVEMGWHVTLAVGRIESEARNLNGVEIIRVRGLSASTSNSSRLMRLRPLMAAADVIHVQNVMNPEALCRIVETGKAVVTVQDHRVFCPGMGKSKPDGSRCLEPMTVADCSVCLEDHAYRERMEALTSERLNALDGAILIVLSRYMAEELRTVGLSKTEVIPPWVHLGPPRGDPGDGFFLAGRLVRHKGVIDGWRAWVDAERPLPLKVAGDGAMAQDLHGVELMGWMGHSRCINELGRSRALLFPSLWQEPFGMLGPESLANGTPVIAAVSGGMEDWTGAGCIVVEPGSLSSFSDAITRLASDPDEARTLGEAGRLMVGEMFSRDVLGPRIQTLYEASISIR